MCPHTANLDEESIHSLSLRSEMFDDLDDTCLRTPSERHAKQHTLHDNLHNHAQETNILPKGDLFMPKSALEITRCCNAEP